MSFLGLGNYNKPGPGVSKDELPKAAPVRFFEIFGRKFTKLVQLNLLFLIPSAVAVVLMLLLYQAPTHYILQLPVGNSAVIIDVWTQYVMPFPLVLLSPFVAGLTYVTRNFAREEHAFILSDFMKAVKENWKFSLINGVICYFVYVLMSFATSYYYMSAIGNSFFYVPLFFCLFVSMLFIFAQFYVPIMIVTFDLSFKQLYKNAFIFAILGIIRNIFIALALVAIVLLFVLVVPIMGLTILIATFLVIIILFSFVSYLINFAVYPLLIKFLIDPFEKRRAEEEAISNGIVIASDKKLSESAEMKNTPEDSPISSTDADEDPEALVYHNGRLVKKSEIKDT